MSLWLPQLFWSGLCAAIGLLCKDFFIVSELTRWIYVFVISSIYLFGSYKLIDLLAAKRAAKYSQKH